MPDQTDKTATSPAITPSMTPAMPPALTPALTPAIGTRMACWVYEGMIMFGVSFTATYLYSSLTQSRHALQHRLDLMFFLFVVFGIYFIYFWHRGQTLPMKTWKMRVYDKTGQQAPTQARAALRYLLSWLWFLPPLALATLFTVTTWGVLVLLIGWVVFYALLARLLPGKQFLHDVLAGTQLLRAEPITTRGLV